MNCLLFALLVCINISANNCALIIDHDGGVDDMIATTLQILYSPKSIKAITIVPADCFVEPAFNVTNWLLRMHNLNIPIGVSGHEGINKFPDAWRQDSHKIANLNSWANTQGYFKSTDIHHSKNLLHQTINESESGVTILETGPCSNLAEVLTNEACIKNNISRIYIMGGAIGVKGNVEELGHDGSAEWNIYNNPQAFKDLLANGIPITLIPLDATQYTPISKNLIDRLRESSSNAAIRFVLDCLKLIQPLIDCGQYYCWDTLTSTAIIKPKIIKTKKMKLDVVTDGISAGRVFESQDGFEVDVAYWADQFLFENTVFDILSGKLTYN